MATKSERTSKKENEITKKNIHATLFFENVGIVEEKQDDITIRRRKELELKDVIGSL